MQAIVCKQPWSSTSCILRMCQGRMLKRRAILGRKLQIQAPSASPAICMSRVVSHDAMPASSAMMTLCCSTWAPICPS